MKTALDHIVNLRKAAVPFIAMGVGCGFAEFMHLILKDDWDVLHIALAFGYTTIGIILLCVAKCLERKEENK